MDFLERDLEDIIFDELRFEEGYDNLSERGLNICYSPDHFVCKRQLKIGNYGIADLVTFSRFARDTDSDRDSENKVFIEVIELKRGEINIDAYIQANRYLTGIKKYMRTYHPKLVVSYSIVLIGRHVNTSDWVYLIEDTKNLTVQTYRYELDGMKFQSHSGYSLRNDGLSKAGSINPF
jgi:hypothetical protein